MLLFIQPVLRVGLAIMLATALFLLLPESIIWELRLIASMDAGAMLLLTLIAIMMARFTPEETFMGAQHQEPSNLVILIATIIISAAGYAAVAFGLTVTGKMSGGILMVHTILSIAGVFASWLLLHTYYGLHYAKCYYDETEDGGGKPFQKGLEFPGGNDVVDYWDFMYYSFTIAMCYQTSDVSITSPPMRRLTLVHAIVSFFFVILGLGLMVNIISNLA